MLDNSLFLASLLVIIKWNHTSCFYLNYYGTSPSWPSVNYLHLQVFLSLNCLWGLFSSLSSCHSILASGRSPALTLMTAALLGTAVLHQWWLLISARSVPAKNPQVQTHPQAFLKRSLIPLGAHRHILGSEPGREKGKSLLFLVQVTLHFLSRWKAMGTSTLRRWNWTPAFRVMIWLDSHGLTIPFPKDGLFNFKQYPMWGAYSSEHWIHFLVTVVPPAWSEEKIRIAQPYYFNSGP